MKRQTGSSPRRLVEPGKRRVGLRDATTCAPWGMVRQEIVPSKHLADVVERFVFYQGTPGTRNLVRVYPSGVVEIVINLTDGEVRCYDHESLTLRRARGPVVAGIHQRFIVIDTGQLESLISVWLRPAGAWQLFGVPATELTNRHVELDQLWSGAGERLWTQLSAARETASRIQILERALEGQRRRFPHPTVAWAAGQMCRYPARVRIGRLAEEGGLSRRRFNELFHREIGISPKGFARLQRFRAVYDHAGRAAHVDWSRLAVEFGYADQAHLIREFRDFAGATPEQFRRLMPA